LFRRVLLLTSLTFSSALLLAQTQSPPVKTAPLVPEDVQILSDTHGVDFGPYLQVAVATVKSRWLSLIPESAKPPIMKSGTVVDFAIVKDGKVAGLMVKQSSGDAALDRAAWEAIADSEPFHRLPDEFSGSYLALRIKFLYNPEKAGSDPQPDQVPPKPPEQESPAPTPPKKTPPAFNVPLSVDTILSTPPSRDGQSEAHSVTHSSPTPPGVEILSPATGVTYDLKMFVQQRVMRTIKQNWYERIPTKAKGPPLTRGVGAVTFSIMRDGSFTSVEMTESTGDDEMDHAALDAVKSSDPIPLPASVTAQYVKLIVRFYYNPPRSKWRK